VRVALLQYRSASPFFVGVSFTRHKDKASYATDVTSTTRNSAGTTKNSDCSYCVQLTGMFEHTWQHRQNATTSHMVVFGEHS
jgi:hypothetical protein